MFGTANIVVKFYTANSLQKNMFGFIMVMEYFCSPSEL